MDKKTYKAKDIPLLVNKIITIHWPITDSVYIGFVRYENGRILIKHPIIIEKDKTINLTFISKNFIQPTSKVIVRLPDEEEYKLYRKIFITQKLYKKWTINFINQKIYHHSSTR